VSGSGGGARPSLVPGAVVLTGARKDAVVLTGAMGG